MGQEGLITRDTAEDIRKVVPEAAATLFESKPGHLDRLLKDINFPPSQADGRRVGRGTYQILFDRKLSGPDEADSSDGNDVANWLYCEWTAQTFKGGDRFIIAVGTITKDNSVDVSCAALAVVTPTSPVEFETAGKIGVEDGKIKKTLNLDEQELQSYLTTFRSGFVNGATLYSGDLED